MSSFFADIVFYKGATNFFFAQSKSFTRATILNCNNALIQCTVSSPISVYVYLFLFQWRGLLLYDLHTALYWKANKKFAMSQGQPQNGSVHENDTLKAEVFV